MKNKTKKIVRFTGIILFIFYMILLVYCLFFSEKYGRVSETNIPYRYNLIPFVEIGRFWKYREQLGDFAFFINVFGNIIGFMPFGALLPVISKKMNFSIVVILLGFGMSFSIEVVQLITKVGCFDVDDMLLNTIGTSLGYVMFCSCNYFRRTYYGEKI